MGCDVELQGCGKNIPEVTDHLEAELIERRRDIIRYAIKCRRCWEKVSLIR